MDATEPGPGALREELAGELSEGVVCALSGGPDSTALLHLLLEAGVPPERIVAAHLDHRLRPDSGDDSDFAGSLAEDVGVRFHPDAVPVRDQAREAGLSIEAAARRARYRFLERVATRAALPFIVTGHHLEDQAETVLLRLLRGTGPAGLRGIHARRPVSRNSAIVLVRPMLGIRRAAILRYLGDRGIPFRSDPTNLDGSNLRSVLRVRLLPLLRDAIPDLDRRLAGLVPAAERLARHTTDESALAPRDPDPRPSVLRARILESLPENGPPMDRAAVDRVLAILDAGAGATDLGGGYSLRVTRGRMNVVTGGGDEAAPPDPAELPCPGHADFGDGWRFSALPDDGAAPDSSPLREVVDRDRVAPPYRVRPAREGDRFRPLGLGAETTVFRFLLSRHVPREERASTPVVLVGDRVVWVVGHRIDERACVTGETVRRAVLSAVKVETATGG